MSVLEAALLGLVQGLTEFFPVSSSGHLVLGQALLGIRTPGIVFEVVLHLATLGAVVWVYRDRVRDLARGSLRGEREAWAYVGLLLLASAPALAAGLLGEEWLAGTFERPTQAAGLLLVTGLLVWSVRRTAPNASDPRPGAGQALWIGLGQALALLPGVSRSGATVAAGSWRGVEAVRLAEFSFLLSVPAILGAGLLQADEIFSAAVGAGPGPLIVGFAAAFASGVAAIRLFVQALERRVFHRFAFYCWIVGAGYLIAVLIVPSLR